MAVKLLGFGTVVTLLVGLPLIRTSTGHGTAFDIAGRNVADHRNLLEAIRAHQSGSFFDASEANEVIKNFSRLRENQKQDVLNFLRSL